MNRITIDGVTYTATPTTNPQPTDKTITLDGVTYILAEEIVGAIEKIRINGKLYDLKDVEEVGDIKEKALQYNTLTVTPHPDTVDIYARNMNGDDWVQTIPAATQKSAGVMSAEDKKVLDEVKRSSAIKITWNANSNMNDFKTPGVYDIYGERTRQDDNLPILNASPGHTVSGRLIVLDSSIDGTGDSQDKCITQLLTLSNRTGEDGNTYIRTASGASLDSLTWKPWATQQTNVNVGQVDNLNNLKDNGIYSGVWTKGSYNAYPLTFVCIVINDYFIGINPRRISQLVYGLSNFDGSTVYQSRVWDDSKNSWSDWEILNQKEISSMISMEISRIVDNAPETFNTLKKIADWINNDKSGAAAMAKQINANANNLAETKENIANQLFATSDADKVTLTGRNEQSMRLNFSADIPAVTTEKAGVMSAADKVALDTATSRALRALFVAAGAEYNDTGADKTKTAPWGETVIHKAGYYYLNGLGDITEEQMMAIYLNKDIVKMLDIGRIVQGNQMLRTMLPIKSVLVSDTISKRAFNGLFSFAQSAIEVFGVSMSVPLNTSSSEHTIFCSTLHGTFFDCTMLRLVYPINVKNVTPISNNTFRGCHLLEELRLFALVTNLDLSDSSNITKDSIMYIVLNSNISSAKSIILHPGAYARLADDVDIVAALEAQPLISLVSA